MSPGLQSDEQIDGKFSLVRWNSCMKISDIFQEKIRLSGKQFFSEEQIKSKGRKTGLIGRNVSHEGDIRQQRLDIDRDETTKSQSDLHILCFGNHLSAIFLENSFPLPFPKWTSAIWNAVLDASKELLSFSSSSFRIRINPSIVAISLSSSHWALMVATANISSTRNRHREEKTTLSGKKNVYE